MPGNSERMWQLEEERKKRKQFQDLGRKMLGSFSYPVALDGGRKGWGRIVVSLRRA